MKELLQPRHVALAAVIAAAPLWTAPLWTAPPWTAPLWAATSEAGAATSHVAKNAAVKAPASVCEKLNAVFSDGPDPDADPVGYALSQILPLGEVHTSDHALRGDLTKLIAADRALVHSNGKDRTAKADIKKDDHLVNEACPGVAP